MRGWTKALLLALALAAAAGACGRTGDLTGPGADRTPSLDEASLDQPPAPPADSTGRWGGGLGSGT